MAFLDELSGACRDALCERGRSRRYPKGSLVFAEGDPGSEVLFVRSGAVKVLTTSASGREVVLDVVEAGHILGELSAIDGRERSATGIALTSVEVVAVPHESFRALLEDNAELQHQLFRTLANRIRGADRRQLEFGASDALGRVCQRLVELLQRNGHSSGCGPVRLESPVSQQDLASWAGLSREAVVKALQALRKLGWIENAGRSMVVLDPEALRRRASE